MMSPRWEDTNLSVVKQQASLAIADGPRVSTELLSSAAQLYK